MKTLNLLLFVLILASFLNGQTDSTDAVTPEAAIGSETVADLPDTTAVQELEPATEVMETNAVAADTLAAETFPESTEMVDTDLDQFLKLEPTPVRIVGLMYDGPLYFWSNDNLENIGFFNKSYLRVEDPTLIAVNAKDCLDIVCHLLASNTTEADYVVVSSADDSTLVQIYEIETRASIIEAPAAQALALFETYLQENGYKALFEKAPPVTPPVVDDTLVSSELEIGQTKAENIRQLQFRSMDALFSNPGNLARNFDAFTSWNLLPDFRVNVHNSLLTPGWYKEWWTTGGVWDDATKNEYLSTIMDQNLALNAIPEFQTLFGFRIGHFGLNISGSSHVKVVLSGNLLGLPMTDILRNEPIENGGLEVEAIPFVAKTALSYAHPLATPYGDLKVGASLNIFEAAGYMRMYSDDLTILVTEDSITISATGEGWATVGGQGQLDDLDTENLAPADMLSDISIGVDLGAILDLSEQLNQAVEVQLSLRNLGAQLKWSNVTHEKWAYNQTIQISDSESDSIETITSEVISTDEELTIKVPTVLDVKAFYQPVHNVLVGVGLEKAFIDEIQFGYSPDLEFSFHLNYYPINWFDISYQLEPRFGDPTHTFGSGFHFGFLDTGIFVSFLNGLNSKAKGIGVGFQSSLHF